MTTFTRIYGGEEDEDEDEEEDDVEEVQFFDDL